MELKELLILLCTIISTCCAIYSAFSASTIKKIKQNIETSTIHVETNAGNLSNINNGTQNHGI